MIDFKTYILIEQIINESVPDDSDWEHSDSISKHEDTVKGKKVKIKVVKTRDKNNITHDIKYTVNGISPKEPGFSDDPDVLKHITNKVHGYISDKVKSGDFVSLSQKESAKIGISSKTSSLYTSKLSSKFGGKHQPNKAVYRH